jgi:hypothetical protein
MLQEIIHNSNMVWIRKKEEEEPLNAMLVATSCLDFDFLQGLVLTILQALKYSSRREVVVVGRWDQEITQNLGVFRSCEGNSSMALRSIGRCYMHGLKAWGIREKIDSPVGNFICSLD